MRDPPDPFLSGSHLCIPKNETVQPPSVFPKQNYNNVLSPNSFTHVLQMLVELYREWGQEIKTDVNADVSANDEQAGC